MRHKIYLTLVMLAVSAACTAQIVTLRGKVTNSQTGAPVPGASILSGPFGTSADDGGNFVFYVQQPIIEESGITVSSIGYQTIHFTDITDNYNVSMTPIIQELKTVDIKAGAEAIVKKAYREIANNYLDKNFNLTGIQKMIHTVRDTFGYQYYYSSEAKVKLYISAYASKPLVVQAGLMEKEQKVKRNPNFREITFTNGYSLARVRDHVHLGTAILKGNATRFSYKFNREELIEGRKTYVINFFSKKRQPDAGILYIDSATYAFVKILYTIYQAKVPGAIDLDKITSFVQYRMYDEKWVLDAAKCLVVTDHNGFDVERTDEFQAAVLTTENATELPSEAIITDRHLKDEDIQPYNGFSSSDKKTPKDVQNKVKSTFSTPQMPKMAVAKHQQSK